MVGSMVFNEGEVQWFIEILFEKVGIIQDIWYKVIQKGDFVVILKCQLEEKEKLLVIEQEDVVVVKSKLREFNKEMVVEKVKVVVGEVKVKKQLVVWEQEIMVVQVCMQVSYWEYVKEVQQLQGKIWIFQEQLENGFNMQLVCLQQENFILWDVLNQVMSQVESKQNVELVKFWQEFSKVSKELVEKLEVVW